MAPRASVDDKLAALRELRGRALTPEQIVELRKRLGDRSNLVVAAAAAIAGENALVELAKELEAAFERFLVNPVKDDKLCRAKLAVVQALDQMEHQETDVFEKAATHVQLEAVWGGSEDTAPPLRAAAIIALARIEGTRSLTRLVDALADPAKEVRSAAAAALGALGTDSAGLILRLKARVGDSDADVLSECLGALLTVDPSTNLPFVREFLEPGTPACDAAVLALGKSRLAEALDPLTDCWRRAYTADLKQRILLAIAILRRPGAIDFLTELVAAEPEPTVIAALAALKIFKHDRSLRDKVERLVHDRGSPALQARFERDFS
jgi:hypothetical protein